MSGSSSIPSATPAPHDVAVIGAGIVGLATAHAICRWRPDLSIVVLDKENTIGRHQTGRNSGVIHAGLYYAPGSLKARLSVKGGRRLVEFCDSNGIPTTRSGKIVLAAHDGQLDALGELERRAVANGVTTERLGPEGIRDHEPHASGIEGLWVPATGAVDFGRVAGALAELLLAHGADVRTGFEVREATVNNQHRRLSGPVGDIEARVVLNCAGLQVDRVARLLGHEPELKILPFRGEYYGLSDAGGSLVRGHLYPVPDPRFPHLGVHFTRSVTGQVEVGPNAVWAWGREAYGRVSGRPSDAIETLRYGGFWKLARTHWRTGIAEQWRSLNKRAFVRNAQAMLPDLSVDHLAAWRSGIRAQAVARDGSLVHDFVIQEAQGVVNVLNAPSPAATACLTIGEHIAKRLIAQVR